jgi:HSP20 family molecular chaperone IbpA
MKSVTPDFKTDFTDLSLVLTVSLPGVPREDVEVSQEGRRLRVVGRAAVDRAPFDGVFEVSLDLSGRRGPGHLLER